MTTLPLHPLVVHFPIVLTFLVPVAACLVGWTLFAKKLKSRFWLIPVILQALVFMSAWIAVELGEKDEERVEAVVAEQVLETHEALGEQFLIYSGGMLLLMLIPLATRSRYPALVIGVLSLVGIALIIPLGHSGGELVYGQGAALAFVNQNGGASGRADVPATPGGEGRATAGRERGRHDDDGDDD